MRHNKVLRVVLTVGLITLYCWILAILQYFLTGVYGKFVFYPLLVISLVSYYLQNRTKVFPKPTDK